MINRILLLIFGALLIADFGFAQKCGTYEGSLEEDTQKYPDFYQSLESKNAEFKLQHEKALSKITSVKVEDGVKIIPVVVHVIHDMGNENISDASIQNAIDILNANINGQAANFLSETPDVFGAVRGDAKVEFRLAKIDPLGNATTGINRVRSTLTFEPEPGNAVKALSYWNSFEYFNIWTVQKFAPQDDGNILLGYAQFPNSNFMSTDGVVLLAGQMANGGTLTHEVGHWLGLRHTWGDSDCGDDGVKDTPPAQGPNYGVNLSDFPYHVGNIGIGSGCLGDSMNWAGEMFVNYMDYSNDAATTMFTIGQNEIMDLVLEGEFNEEDSISEIGFREYMWSDENIANTGTGDGYLPPFCSQEASFVSMTGASSICEGEALLLKGNKTMFGAGNVTSFVWDFGDGNTDNSGDNFLSHPYSSLGSFDVTLTIGYNETIEVRASDPNLLPGGPATYDAILVDHMVHGTFLEIGAMGATNITEIPLDSLGLYFDMQDSSYFRGVIQKAIYTATYDTTCISSVTKVGFVNVNTSTATSNSSSYSYSFENEADLNGDWGLSPSTNVESQWSFNTGNTTAWKWESGTASHGTSSLKVDREDMFIGISTEIVSKAYDLSALTTPAIKFSWSGASINAFPVNELVVTYSDDCGESWKPLGTIGAVETSNAGLYATTSFKPKSSEWDNIVMTKTQLQNPNIKFKFEYRVIGSSNNFYLDDIQIGEYGSLMIDENTINSKLSIFPNPTTKGNATIVLDNIADKNIEISLINILGAEISTLFSGTVVSKHQEILADLTTFKKGIYFVKVVSNDNVIMTDKLIIE